LIPLVRRANNVSGPSNGATETVFTLDVTPPSTPTNLVASSTEKPIVNLSWDPSTDNVGVVGMRFLSKLMLIFFLIILVVTTIQTIGRFLLKFQVIQVCLFHKTMN